MKSSSLSILFVGTLFFLASCNPVEEGVYFEFDGHKCTSEGANIANYEYTIDNTGGPKFRVYVESVDFIFELNTYSLQEGYTYFNEVDATNNHLVLLGITLVTTKFGSTGSYFARNDAGGYDNALEILQFDENIFEAKFNARLLPNNVSNPSYNIRNGYIKIPL